MVNSVSNTASTASSSSTSSSSAIMGKDDFLKLMIAQLKNQDPLNPMDGTEYASQLAQFSSLEQLSNLNSYMQQSINANAALTQSINNTLIANMIGKEVKVSGSDLVVNNQDNIGIGYDLSQAAKSVKITIKDSNGVVYKTIDGTTDLGSNKVLWDLSDDNGGKVPNGNYTMTVTAYDASGQEISVDSYKMGAIDGIRYTDSGTMVVIDGAEYSIADITEVVNPKNNGDN